MQSMISRVENYLCNQLEIVTNISSKRRECEVGNDESVR